MPLKSLRVRFQEAAGDFGPRLTRNALMAIGQSLIVAVSLFVAYREVIRQTGLEAFGMWSVLVAVSTIVRVADFSGGGALSRFLAKAGSNGEAAETIKTAHTVLLSSIVLNAALFVAVLLLVPLVLPLIFDQDKVDIARSLLPWAALTIVCGNIATAISSGLDGMHRADLRSALLSIAAIAFAIITYVLTASLGMVGFAVAQLIQQAIIVLIGWMVLRKLLSDRCWVPLHWRADIFYATAPYAAKLGAVSVLGLVVDPISKIVINATAGPATVATFDIASKLIQQARGPIYAAAVTFVPRFAASNPGEEDFKTTLSTALRISSVMAVFFPVAVILLSLPVGLAVLGSASSYFVYVCAALAFGHAVNILSIPPFIAGQSMGVIRWNFVSQLVGAGLSLALLLLLAPAFAGYAVIGAIPLGLVCGALIAFRGNLSALGLRDMERRQRPRLALVMATTLLLSVAVAFIVSAMGRAIYG